MRAAKRFLIILGISLAVLICVGVLVLAIISRPERTPERKPIPDYSSFGLEDKVGVYLTDEGEHLLVTFAPGGGLALYNLVGRRSTGPDYRSKTFIPQPDGDFLWESHHDDSIRHVTFGRVGGTPGFSWQDQLGGVGSASRLPSHYQLTELSWQNGDVTLHGTAFIPETGVRAGMVVAHGSGASDRDNLWYMQIILELVEHGVAVLFPDKRGTGKSGGEWRTSGFEDFAMDVLCGRAPLAQASGLSPADVGLLGVSQGGGWVVPTATRLAQDLPFIVSLVGPAVTVNDQLAHETRQTLRQSGAPAFLDFVLHPIAYRVPQRRRSVWYQKNGAYDPIEDWRRAQMPVLFVFGEEDEFDNVPVAESVRRLKAAQGQRRNFTIRVIPGVGHGLRDQETRELDPAFLDSLRTWVYANTGDKSSGNPSGSG